MEFNLNEPIAKRKTKTVYRDENKTIKLFVENYSKAAILNEALIQARVEENTDLKISKLLEVTKIENKVPSLNRIKDKYKRRLEAANNINEDVKYELLQRLQGMKNHDKLCHGDFNPSNIIIKENGEHYIIDWAHATQGNASADVARTFLIFSMEGKNKLAEKYLEKYCQKTNTDKQEIQRWIPIVAAIRLTKNTEQQELLQKWVDIVDYQ